MNQHPLAFSEDFQPYAKQKPSCAWRQQRKDLQSTLLLETAAHCSLNFVFSRQKIRITPDLSSQSASYQVCGLLRTEDNVGNIQMGTFGLDLGYSTSLLLHSTPSTPCHFSGERQRHKYVVQESLVISPTLVIC